MIPDSAIEAAHKAWREQAKQDGTIFEYNLRAAIEAAAPHIIAQTAETLANGLQSWGGVSERAYVEGFAEAAWDKVAAK